MNHRCLAAVLTVLAVVALTPIFAAAQSASAPRTPWGQPDLQGVWDFRTITPLQRPEELADKEFFTEEEAANLEQEAVDRDARLWEQGARKTEAGGNVGAYNNFWMDRGLKAVGTRRTSLIVDPPDGRLPPLTAAAQRLAESQEAQRIADVRREGRPAASWADLDAGDRCIQHAKAGPPISTGGYNNNIQLFQTPDQVAILNEQNHDVRIVPLDGRPHVKPQIQQWMGDSRGRWDVRIVPLDGRPHVATRSSSRPSTSMGNTTRSGGLC